MTYPSGYEGDEIPGGNDQDLDNDGLSDYIESPSFPDRDEVFCNTTTLPHTCAYPDLLTKDIYVEIDWMKDPVANKTYKPSTTQLGLVADMFDEEGINIHFDTGEYGGGNELDDYDATLRRDNVDTIPDFADYKNGGDGISSNFDPNRLGIWRYMIYGKNYSTSSGPSTSSGWAEVMGDDLFISGEVAENSHLVGSGDRNVARTIAHELGHGLCLSGTRAYLEQDGQCVFKGIDNRTGSPEVNDPDAYYNLEDYVSVMNYRYQLLSIDIGLGDINYSHGSNSSTNNDDWSAVKNHVGSFNKQHTVYTSYGARNSPNTTLNHSLSADGLVIAE